MSHKPGPWRYWGCKVDRHQTMYDYWQFACPNDHVFRAPIQYLREEDARLIAAAPELLEALKALIADMGVDEADWSNPKLNKARIAIYRAEG